MTELTKQELRELDAWIALNVTDWKPRNPQPCTYPHYTIDQAASMAVLQRCIEWDAYTTGERVKGMKGEPLPLAIALFAKKLFGGSNE